MSVIASALKHMLAAGMPHDAIVEAVAAMEANIGCDPVAEKRRAYDRERRRAERAAAKADLSTGHTRTSAESVDKADIVDAPPFPAPAPSFPPHPQTNPTPTHTPGVVSTRTRKADPFPMPDGVDADHWRDFLANRKRKRLPNTPTAHKRLMQDIARLADEDWPPGRLIEHAAAHGWAALFGPRQDNRHDRPDRHSPPDRRPANPLVRAGLAFESERIARSDTDVR